MNTAIHTLIEQWKQAVVAKDIDKIVSFYADDIIAFDAVSALQFKGKVAYVAGYTGLGVGATRFGAQVMLDLLDGIDNERTRLKMVQTKPVPFPPEPVRFAGIELTRRSIALADRREGKRNLWLRTLDKAGLGFDS